MKYVAPWWLPGGHAQTIWPALFSRCVHGKLPRFRRERWDTPDGDFLDVDWSYASTDESTVRPLMILFHGLEGSSSSHYAQSFADWCADQGWDFVVPHFRGCSGEINRAPRAYHSGDFAEIAWILQEIQLRHKGPRVAVGISLGGNALLRWAEEAGSTANGALAAVAAVCSPINLAAGGEALGRGIGRQIYTRMFLRTMKPKALRKWEQHPGLFDRQALIRARDLYEFDNVFTAPLHGFRDTDDYWHRASAQPHLDQIRLPALVVNALNDPFVPARSLPTQREVGSFVTLWQPSHGGHVGFAQGRWPGHVRGLPDSVGPWLAEVASLRTAGKGIHG